MNGVSFDGVHSYNDLHLVLTEAEIGLPEVKTSYLEIPGADGDLDLTETLTGAACYGNRELKLTFQAPVKLNAVSWSALLASLTATLHGQKKQIVFDDDTGWAYRGRCAIDSFGVSRWNREVKIICNCEPYQISTEAGSEERRL